MSITNPRRGLPVSLAIVFAVACSSPVVTPPLELPAPVLETDTRVDAAEGVAFSHQIKVTSEAPPVALSLEGAPTGLAIDATGKLTWTPDFDQAGDHVMTVVATDAQAMPLTTRLELTLVVANTNRAPTEPQVTTTASFPLPAGATFSVEASATDPDGDDLVWTWAVSDETWELVADGDSVSVKAPSTRNATAQLTVTVSDGEASRSATIELSTFPNNAPDEPVISTDAVFPVERGAEVVFTATAEDADDDALTWTWTVSDESWALAADGASVTVTAASEKAATAVLTAVVSDGFTTASATFDLNTLPNRAPGQPQLTTDATFPVRWKVATTFAATATDPDGDALSYVWTVSDDSWTLETTGATAVVTATEKNAAATLTVTVSDGELTASTTYELTSLSNEAPDVSQITTDATLPLEAGVAVDFNATATDADGDDLVWSWTLSPTDDWELTGEDATARVKPLVRGATGVLTATVSDGELTASATFDLASTENIEPTVTMAPADATLLATKTLSLSAQGDDADGDDLTFTWTIEGDGWSVAGDGETAIVTAPAVVDAVATVTVTVADGWGGSTTATHMLTTTGVGLRGKVDFLQAGTFSLEAGGERVEVSANGPFQFTTTRLAPTSTLTLTFPAQPDGQRCAVAGGPDTVVGEEEVEVSVVCSLIGQSTAPVATTLVTTSTTYEPVSGVEPLAFELSKPAHALLTLSVPHVAGDPTNGVNGKVWVAVTIDDVPVSEALWQSAAWSQGGPLGLVTTVPLAAGAHTVKAVWRLGDKGASAQILAHGSVVLTATVVESLPYGRGGSRVEASFEGETATTTPTALPLGPLALSEEAYVLASAHMPDVHTTGAVSFTLKHEGTPVADGNFHHEGTSHAVPLVALRSAAAGDELTVDWSSNATATLGDAPVSLSAAMFDPRIEAASVSGSTSWAGSTSTFQTILTIPTETLTLTEEKSVLVVFQAPSAFLHNNGHRGEIAIRTNGEVVSLARIQSQNGDLSSPVVMSAIVRLPAGEHVIDVAARRLDSEYLRLSTGLRSLTAIVLD